jgi:hypothetical protein
MLLKKEIVNLLKGMERCILLNQLASEEEAAHGT